MFIQNKYYTWYYKIINNSLNQYRSKKDDVYYEKHHIVPRSLGGLDNSENLVLLTAKEHFICHLLLINMCKNERDKGRMVYALNRMINDNSGNRYTSRAYSYIRKIFSREMSEYSKKRYSEYGFRPYGENTRWMNKNGTYKRVDLDNVDYYLNNGWVFGGVPTTEKQKEVASKTHKNKNVSSDTRNKMRQSAKKYQKENGNPTKGLIWIHKNGQTKRIIENDLEKYLNDGWAKGLGYSPGSENIKNTIWINNGIKNKRVSPEEFQKYDDRWVKGFLSKSKKVVDKPC